MLQAALDDAMETEAVVTVGEVKKRIITGPFVPNAPTTIAKKGSDKPLIDTGQLLDAIDYKMHKPGQKE